MCLGIDGHEVGRNRSNVGRDVGFRRALWHGLRKVVTRESSRGRSVSHVLRDECSLAISIGTPKQPLEPAQGGTVLRQWYRNYGEMAAWTFLRVPVHEDVANAATDVGA